MLSKQTLEKLNEFLNIDGKKYLYYHRDQDGICSASLILKFYPGFDAITKKGPRLTKESLDAMIRNKPDVVVFVDLPVDHEWKLLQTFQKEVPSAKIVIIDHHIYEKNLNSESVVHINPLFEKKIYQSASYLVYNILKKVHGNKVKRFLWIAMMGAIGDYDLSGSLDMVKESKEKYPHLIGKDPHDSELAKGAKLLGAAITMKNWKGAKEALDTLVKAETYDDFATKKKFKDYKKQYDNEFRRVLDTAERENIPECNLVIFKIESELSMVSNISNYFSTRYPDKIIIVRKKSMTEWKFSVRFQNGKINLGTIIKKAISDIGTGGGHPKAAAGMTEDWDKFKENFIRKLKNIKG